MRRSTFNPYSLPLRVAAFVSLGTCATLLVAPALGQPIPAAEPELPVTGGSVGRHALFGAGDDCVRDWQRGFAVPGSDTTQGEGAALISDGYDDRGACASAAGVSPQVEGRVPALLEVGYAAGLATDEGGESAVDPIRELIRSAPYKPFALRDVEDEQLYEFVSYYLGEGRRRIVAWVEASGRFDELIREELARQQAPRELLWVVAVESAFEPEAISHAGAGGLWQFMPRTGRAAGLRIDRYVDERLDPVASTRAAIPFLLGRRERFGDWLLALAAYNAGSGHLRGELREHSLNDFWALTHYGAVYDGARRYALRVATIALLAENAEHFGFGAIEKEEHWAWDLVEVPGGVRLSVLASAADASTDELRRLNPSLVRGQTPPDDDAWMLRLPDGTRDDFVASYDRVARRYGTEHVEIVTRFGESLEQIAETTGVPARVLRYINDLEAFEDPEPGRAVLVPEGRLRRGSGTSDETDGELPVVVVPPSTFHYPTRHRIFYRVIGGDELVEIADHFGVTTHELRVWNDLSPTATLWSRMWLQLFVDELPDPERTVFHPASAVRALERDSEAWQAWRDEQESSSRRRRTYTVQRGDTVGGVARRFGVTTSQILRWNDLDDADRIVVGEELIVGR